MTSNTNRLGIALTIHALSWIMARSSGTCPDLVPDIDSRVENRHLLKHPFYQAWTAGTLSREVLRDYASQYYHHVAAFPTYVSGVHSQTDDAGIRRHLLQNLIEEEAGSPNHPELWMTFAESLGLTREQVESVQLWPETRALIEGFRACCTRMGTTAGLAALYAYESQIPAVSESKISGLRKFYGFNEPANYRYFDVHIEADEQHSKVERDLLHSCSAPEQCEPSLRAVDHVLDLLWNMLSAVCARHSVVQ